MPTLTIKKMPQELYDRLRQSAAQHRRSINSEILFCLERTLYSRRLTPEQFLARLDAFQERLKYPPLTEDLLEEAKTEGRP